MAYTTFVLPFRPVFDSNGLPVPGAKLNFYLTGTVIRTPVYADSALTTELPNPVVANSAGRFVDIFMDGAVIYRVTVADEDGVVLDDADPYSFGNAGVGVDLISTQTISGAKTFSSNITIPDEVYGVAWNGALTVPSKNAVYDKIEGLSGLYQPAGSYQPLDDQLTSLAAIAYAGNAGEVVRVNSTATGFETAPSGDALLSSTTTTGPTAFIQQTVTGYSDLYIECESISHDSGTSSVLQVALSPDGTTFSAADVLTVSQSLASSFDDTIIVWVRGLNTIIPSAIGFHSDAFQRGDLEIQTAATMAIRVQWSGGSIDASSYIRIRGRI